MASNHYSRALARHYGILALAALLAFGFHANVNHRFYEMVVGLKEAAAVKKQLQVTQLKMLDHHRLATLLHAASRNDTRQAYAYHDEAEDIAKRVDEERLEASELHKEATALRNKAEADGKEGMKWLGKSLGDNLLAFGSNLKSELLAKEAEEEATEAQVHMNHSIFQEEQGNQKLAEAEEGLEAAREIRAGLPAMKQGMCTWMHWACDLVRRNPAVDQLQKATDVAIAAAAEMAEALQELRNAKEERDLALELYHNSTVHTNSSLVMLEEAKELQELVKFESSKVREYADKARGEQIQAFSEEQQARQEDAQVYQEHQKVVDDYTRIKQMIGVARDEEDQAQTLEQDILLERGEIEEAETRVKNIIRDAKRHVAHACWYALLACVSGAALLALVMVRIIDTFRRQQPLRWIIRETPFTTKDVIYVCNHGLIFFLVHAYTGALLMEYGKHDLLGRMEIVILFALIGAFFQGVLLHFIPNMVEIVFTSTFSGTNLKTLLVENVAKRGLILFLVFVESLVVLASCRYGGWGVSWYSLKHAYPSDLDSSSASFSAQETEIQALNPSVNEEQETESSSLVTNSTISALTDDSTLLFSVTLDSPGTRSPATYGSLAEAGNASISNEITSTFITSWRSELEKVRLLFELLIASWAVWIIRRDTGLITKLSPLSPDLIWGRFPFWILEVILILLFGITFRIYALPLARTDGLGYWASKTKKLSV